MGDDKTDGLTFSRKGMRDATKLYKLDADGAATGFLPQYQCKPSSEVKSHGFSSDEITVEFPAINTKADTKTAARKFVLDNTVLNNLLQSVTGGLQKGAGSGGLQASALGLLLPDKADATDVRYLVFDWDFDIGLDTLGHEPAGEAKDLKAIKVELSMEGEFEASDDDGDSSFAMKVTLDANDTTLVDETMELVGEDDKSSKKRTEGTLDVGKFTVTSAGQTIAGGAEVKENKRYKFTYSFAKADLAPVDTNILLTCFVAPSAQTDISLPIISSFTNNSTTLSVNKLVLKVDPVHAKK